MSFATITLTREGAISRITLNRPEMMNALDSKLIAELNQAVDKVAEDKESRVLVISGNEKVFAAGGDIKAMINCGPNEAHSYIEPIHALFKKIAELPKPTIAAISGFVFGGGIELALSCDFRIAADNAKFGFPEINLGIFPGAGGSQRLPRLIGVAKAKELMYIGDTIDAYTAWSIGLVNQVISLQEFPQNIQAFAAKLGNKPPLALKALKESIHSGLNTDLNNGLKIEIEKVCSLFATQDQKEGMKAFIERRAPRFTGN